MTLPAPSARLQGVVIAFDLDGTLVDTAPDLMGALNTLLGQESLPPLAYDTAPLLGQEGLPPLAYDTAPLLVGRGAKIMIERGFAAAGEPLDEARASSLFERYITLYLGRIADRSVIFDGVIPALDALEAEGAILAVCTNKRTDLSLALMDKLDLTRRFKAIVGADMAPRAKPDASHLLHTIALCGGDPARALMVGDSINDVLAAKNAEVPVVVVSFGYTDIPPKDLGGDVLIDQFDELYDVAMRLLSSPSR